MKTLLLLLLASLTTSVENIPFVDRSLADSPISLAESVGASRFVMHNVSDKEILGYIVDFTFPDTNGFHALHDTYFNPAGLKAGGKDVVDLPPDPSMAPATENQGTVRYVLFVDGSEWGDKELGQELFRNRQGNLAFFSDMIAVYGKEGERGLNQLVATGMAQTYGHLEAHRFR
jgi:hypothetical protein